MMTARLIRRVSEFVMGNFPFDIPADPSPSWAEAIDGAWLSSSYDRWPVPSERHDDNGKLVLDRKESESAILSLLFPDASGARVVSTSTLRPNAEPYNLTTELARGSINRLRNAL